MATCSFDLVADDEAESVTLIEGLPGHGLVASIVVDHIASQLDLEYYGGIRSEEVPPVVSFADGLVHDTVRVYAGSDPDILTLHGDVVLPEAAFRPFSRCVLQDLARKIDEGIFLAAAPARSAEEHGTILGVATTEAMRDRLVEAGVELAEGTGLVGGITGAIVDECHQQEVPAALVLVRADPHVPDPEAAQLVIDRALRPMVDFDIDTASLLEQAKQIQQRKAQLLQQLDTGAEPDERDRSAAAGMFQ